jgi:general secretion pathway protein D
MIEVIDLPTSEVTLDVQVLEIVNDGTLKLGLDLPSEVSLNVSDDLKDEANGISLRNLGNLNSETLTLGINGPLARLNMLQEANKTQILANPRIRVRNREKASISIGERVPVVSTTNANGVVSETVSYQDVGLKLDVEPSISLNNEIVIKVSLDVSNITKSVETKNGLIVYNLSARAAKTTLSARNHETQVLAGLINTTGEGKTAGVPWLSQIPWLGRLFGTQTDKSTKTEVVLLITPRVERSLALPAANVSRFDSGTEQQPGDAPRLGNTSYLVISNGAQSPEGAVLGKIPAPVSSSAVPGRPGWRPVPPPPPAVVMGQSPSPVPVKPQEGAAKENENAPANDEAPVPRTFGGATTGATAVPK